MRAYDLQELGIKLDRYIKKPQLPDRADEIVRQKDGDGKTFGEIALYCRTCGKPGWDKTERGKVINYRAVQAIYHREKKRRDESSQ